MTNSFEKALTGGHPNSLGNTLDVVEQILHDKNKLEELYACYFSQDAVVRLRTSNAFKRITRAHPEWFVPYIDRFLEKISQVNQASTKWTLANLFELVDTHLTPAQLQKAKAVLMHNLETSSDWIVRKNTMETLGKWAKTDEDLKEWLIPHLKRLQKDPKKVVPKMATKVLGWLK